MGTENPIEEHLQQVFKLDDPYQKYYDFDWSKYTTENNIDLMQIDGDAMFDDRLFLPMLQDPFNSNYWHQFESVATSVNQKVQELNLEEFTMTKEPEPPRIQMPTLTKTQKRMSLGLLDIKKQRTSNINESLSLSKPPETGTSSIYVTTNAKAPSLTKQFTFKNTVRDFLDKLRHGGTKVTTKTRRRLSLVDENLPNYIRKQIVDKSPEPPEQNNDEVSLPGKSRFSNVLANSQSIYANRTHKSSSNTSAASESRTTEDREYILPGLFTKYIRGLGDSTVNQDELEEDNEDEDEFINVNATSDEYLFK